MKSCDGPIAAGERIDTASAGEHSFSVTAVDEAGNSTTRSVTYTVRAADTGGSPGSGNAGSGPGSGDAASGPGDGGSTPGGSGSTPGGSGNAGAGSGPQTPSDARGQTPAAKASALRFGSVRVRKGRLLTIGLSNPNAAALSGTVKVTSGRDARSARRR